MEQPQGKPKFDRDWIIVAGVVTLLGGLWWLYPPAVPIAAGLMLIAAGLRTR